MIKMYLVFVAAAIVAKLHVQHLPVVSKPPMCSFATANIYHCKEKKRGGGTGGKQFCHCDLDFAAAKCPPPPVFLQLHE